MVGIVIVDQHIIGHSQSRNSTRRAAGVCRAESQFNLQLRLKMEAARLLVGKEFPKLVTGFPGAVFLRWNPNPDS